MRTGRQPTEKRCEDRLCEHARRQVLHVYVCIVSRSQQGKRSSPSHPSHGRCTLKLHSCQTLGQECLKPGYVQETYTSHNSMQAAHHHACLVQAGAWCCKQHLSYCCVR